MTVCVWGGEGQVCDSVCGEGRGRSVTVCVGRGGAGL